MDSKIITLENSQSEKASYIFFFFLFLLFAIVLLYGAISKVSIGLFIVFLLFLIPCKALQVSFISKIVIDLVLHKVTFNYTLGKKEIEIKDIDEWSILYTSPLGRGLPSYLLEVILKNGKRIIYPLPYQGDIAKKDYQTILTQAFKRPGAVIKRKESWLIDFTAISVLFI